MKAYEIVHVGDGPFAKLEMCEARDGDWCLVVDAMNEMVELEETNKRMESCIQALQDVNEVIELENKELREAAQEYLDELKWLRRKR